MRKETLRSLKRINATPKMVQMAKNNKKRMLYKSIYGWSNKEKHTEFDLLVRVQTRGAYLMVCLFYPEKVAAGELTPTYEIYCNPEGNEYITRYLKNGVEKGWLTAMVGNLEENWNRCVSWYEVREYPGMKKRVWQNSEGKKTIQRFLGTKGTGLAGLKEWQQKAKDKKTEEAEAREKAPWDADMKLVPPLIPSFENWMKKEAADKYFIIYEYDRNQDEGWCSGCQKFVPVVKPRHNQKGKCVRCGRNITFKAASRIKTLRTEWYRAQCIQKIKGGIVIRSFEQTQWYRDVDYREPNSITSETQRTLILDDGTIRHYDYGLYKNKEHRFILDKNYRSHGGYYHFEKKVYTRNLKRLKSTALKKSTIDLWNGALPTSIEQYLVIENESTVIEKLVRIGMLKLAKEIIDESYWNSDELFDLNATELTKMLKLDKARLKRLQAVNGGIEHLEWYQLEKQRNTIWPDAMIKDLGDEDLQESNFGFLPQDLSNVKIWNYLKRQQTLAGGRALYLIQDTWRDYLNMAKKAKMDVSNERIWKPKDLQAAHNEVVLLLQQGEMEKEAEKLEKKWPKVNGNLPKLKKFEYADKDFAVLAPENILDIVKEGRILQHCVHTCDFYFDRIQRDETYLFFLRRADHKDIPWYTLEVEAGGNIRQKRTTGDNQNKDFDEAVAFLKKWQKVFVKRLSKEEKEAGKKADQARIREYEELRKNENRVWHGKLAGQLLADVLEADFMAAAT